MVLIFKKNSESAQFNRQEMILRQPKCSFDTCLNLYRILRKKNSKEVVGFNKGEEKDFFKMHAIYEIP